MPPCAGPYEKAKTLMEMGGRTDPCVACTQVRPWLLLLTPARIGTDCAAGQSTAQDAPSRAIGSRVNCQSAGVTGSARQALDSYEKPGHVK